ncbi:hypothetical protein [Mycobacterium syngnathidarum]
MTGRKLTGPQQRIAVSQGVALGLSVLDRYEFAFDKFRIDLAFERAWRDWPSEYRDQFPQVSTDLRNGTDAVWVMTRASEKKRVTPLFWDWSGPQITIYQRGDDWDSTDPDKVEYALNMVGSAVPLDGWLSIATSFLTAYDR